MKQQLDKALDHLILLHRIEEKKLPTYGIGKVLSFGVLVLGMLIMAEK